MKRSTKNIIKGIGSITQVMPNLRAQRSSSMFIKDVVNKIAVSRKSLIDPAPRRKEPTFITKRIPGVGIVYVPNEKAMENKEPALIAKRIPGVGIVYVPNEKAMENKEPGKRITHIQGKATLSKEAKKRLESYGQMGSLPKRHARTGRWVKLVGPISAHNMEPLIGVDSLNNIKIIGGKKQKK